MTRVSEKLDWYIPMNAITSEDKGENDVDVDQNKKLFSNFIGFISDFWTSSKF